MPTAWKGTISFGLVNIPITLYPAFKSKEMEIVEELEDPNLLNSPPLKAEVGKKELDLARQLVTTLRGTFDPEEFRDTHRARLEETLREKVEKEVGHRRRRSGRPGGDRKVIDLMDRLKESLERGGVEHSKGRSKGRPVAAAHAGSHAQGERPYRRRKAG